MEDSKSFVRNALEATIRIAVIGALVIWTYHIVKPFVMPVVWGGIIAIAVEPFIDKLVEMAGGHRKTMAALFALVIIVALVVPLVLISTSSLSALEPWIKNINKAHLAIPPPPARVNGWPVIGHEVTKLWTFVATNLGTMVRHLEPQIKMAITSIFGIISGGFKMMVMFMVSIIISAAFLATAETSAAMSRRIVHRFAGDKGPEICDIATATIRAVMLGVVGVAVIQSVLATIGMLLVGVPVAGLWGVLVLVCAVIQLPTILVTVPIAAWVFFTKNNTTVSVIFLIWCILVGLSDNVLKPLFIGHGVDIPMLVLLVGALGGMMLSGIIGLFIGAVIVAIFYKLLITWIHDNDGSPASDPDHG